MAHLPLAMFLLLWMFPALFRAPAGASEDLRTWSRAILFNDDSTTIAQRSARSYTWHNGSLVSVANRLVRPVNAHPQALRQVFTVNFVSLSFLQIKIIVVAESLWIGWLYLELMPSYLQRTGATDATEQAMLMILIIICAPLSFTYNNTWFLFSLAAIIHFVGAAEQSLVKRRWAGGLLVIALVLLTYSAAKPEWARYVRAAGNTFWAGMFLFADLALILMMQRFKGS